jgi:hypothetical protein
MAGNYPAAVKQHSLAEQDEGLAMFEAEVTAWRYRVIVYT